jgi:hypothetical protein
MRMCTVCYNCVPCAVCSDALVDCTEPQDGCQGAFSMVRMEIYCSIYKLDRVSGQRDSGPADCTPRRSQPSV